MGLFDDVHLEYDDPALPGIPRDYQTKSFDPCMDQYTINKDGRLIRTARIFKGPDPKSWTEEVADIDFHGDMRMYTSTESGFQEYIVRFTHGTLEWIKPMADVPKEILDRLR